MRTNRAIPIDRRMRIKRAGRNLRQRSADETKNSTGARRGGKRKVHCQNQPIWRKCCDKYSRRPRPLINEVNDDSPGPSYSLPRP